MNERFYHVTNRRFLASILERGLRTDAMGWDAGYVWMFDDLAVASEAARTGAWAGSKGDNAVIEINATGLGLIPDPHPGWGDDRDAHAWAHSGHVAPDRLQEVTPTQPLPAG